MGMPIGLGCRFYHSPSPSPSRACLLPRDCAWRVNLITPVSPTNNDLLSLIETFHCLCTLQFRGQGWGRPLRAPKCIPLKARALACSITRGQSTNHNTYITSTHNRFYPCSFRTPKSACIRNGDRHRSSPSVQSLVSHSDTLTAKPT